MNTSQYAFADRAQEQRRLASQAELFDPLTERLFRTAGLGNGMRVLDVGSGAGDVAMLAARLVGREGAVVGVERDPEAVASATARVAQAGLPNVRLVQGDAQTLDGIADGFDAAVGRLILMYLPDPAAALRRAAGLVRPGGLVCFHESDLSYDWAAPMTPLWTQMRAWFLAVLEIAVLVFNDSGQLIHKVWTRPHDAAVATKQTLFPEHVHPKGFYQIRPTAGANPAS